MEETDLGKLDVVGEKMVQLLTQNGFPSIASIAKSALEDLCEVPGIGPKRAQLLIDAAVSFDSGVSKEGSEGGEGGEGSDGGEGGEGGAPHRE